MKRREELEVRIDLYTTLKLIETSMERKLSGTSKKKVFQDIAGADYYLKQAKPRKPGDIFKDDPHFNHLKQQRQVLFQDAVFNLYTEEPDDEVTRSQVNALDVGGKKIYQCLQDDIEKYVDHVRCLILKNMFLEVLASSISTAIMGDLLVSPLDDLVVYQNSLAILSQSVGDFREFLAERSSLCAATAPSYWREHRVPSLIELDLSEDEAKIIGQAYCVALIFGHYDLVNNINLSNFGYVCTNNGGLKLSIVDWGNSLGVGFNGLTADESAFKNPQFIPDVDDELIDFISELTGFKYLMPFDELVYPKLPRQLIPDLFDLTSHDLPKLRQVMRQGFYDAAERAVKVLGGVRFIIHDALVKIRFKANLNLIPILAQIKYLDCDEDELSRIIEGRIKSVHKLSDMMRCGGSLAFIADTVLYRIKNSQRFGFFCKQNNGSIDDNASVETVQSCWMRTKTHD